MENMIFCQSCGMPLQQEADYGTKADGSKNDEYCCHCFANGAFTTENTMEEMIEICVPYVSKGNPYSSENEARTAMQAFFPTLKRWQN